MNHRTRALLIGILSGAFLGAAFAWLAGEVAEDDMGNKTSLVSQLGPMDYFSLAIAILTLARQFGGMLKKA